MSAAEFIEIWQGENLDNPAWSELYRRDKSAYHKTKTTVVLSGVDIQEAVEIRDRDGLLDLHLIDSTILALNI